MALGVASGFALAWPVLKGISSVANWIAENKLDAFGWTAFFALLADPWVQWTAKVGKMMGYVFY